MTHKGTVTLETERLLLRRIAASDAEMIYRNWAFDAEVTKFLTWKPYKSIEDAYAFIGFCTEGYEKDDFYQWGIEIKETHQIIGSISVVHINEEVSSLELGWAIGRAYWGQGIMPEAARRVLTFLFNEVGANRVSARFDTRNTKSGRVMQKIGMTYEGTLRQSDRNNLGIVDCAHYSILKSEYENSLNT